MSKVGKVRKNYIYLNGEDACIELPDSFVQNTDEITVYIEYEWEEPNGHYAYFFGNGGSQRSFIIYGQALYWANGVLQIGFMDNSGVWRSHNWYGTTQNVRNSRWVLGQYKKGHLRAFLEGANAEWTDFDYDMLQGVPFKYIGWYNGTNMYFKGRIYKVLVWFRYLNDDEIDMVKNGDYPTDSLKLWLDGDSIDEVNQVWQDKSGNGNNGQFVGNVKIVKDVSVENRSGLVFDGVDDYVKGLNVRNLQFTNNKTIVLFGNMLKKVKNYKSLYMYSYPTPYHIYSFDGELYFRIVTDSGKIDFSEYRINMLHRDTFGAFILSGDGTNFSCKTYEDGVLLGKQSNTISGNFVSGDKYYQINDTHYNIKLSLFAVFNEAKPDDWIKQFYEDWQNGVDMSKYCQDDSCVLWLDGDSIGEDGVWYDKSGKGNNGQIYGALKICNVVR